MNILAIDLGGYTGYAYGTRGEILDSGVCCVKQKTAEHYGKRYFNFYSILMEYIETHPADLIAYELVRGHRGIVDAHAWGGYEAILMLVSLQREIPCIYIHTGTLKKFATGSGKASKIQMITAAREAGLNFNSTPSFQDNEADAYWILRWAQTQETYANKETPKTNSRKATMST